MKRLSYALILLLCVVWATDLWSQYYSQGRTINLSVLQGAALDSVNFEIMDVAETMVLDTTITPLAGTESKVVRFWWTLPSGLTDGFHTCFEKLYFNDGRVYYDEESFLVYNDFQNIATLTTTTLLNKPVLGLGTVAEVLSHYDRTHIRIRYHRSTSAVTAQGIPGGGYIQWDCIEIDSLRTWVNPQRKYYRHYHYAYDGFYGQYLNDYIIADNDSIW